MKKVVSEELGLLQSKRAKRLVMSVKAATLAGAITIGSMFGTVSSKAASMDSEGDMFVAFDANGNLIENPEAPAAYATDGNTTVNGDAKASGKDVQSDLIGTMDDKFTGEFVSDKASEDEVIEARKLATQGTSNVTEKKEVDSKLLDNIENATREEREVNVDIESEYSGKCLPVLEDVPMEAVTEDYIGIAPIGYVGKTHEMKNYGDASNYEEVKARAEKIYNAFKAANEEYTANYGGPVIINVMTGQEYTLEEIIAVIQYMNGAYAATSDADAQYINDLWIEFEVAFLNDMYLIEDVNYKAGNSGFDGPITEEDVVNHDNILERVSLFDLLMGDNANGPFLKWFSDKIIEMNKETDPEKAAAIFNEAYLAIVAIVEGNGFVINGVNYKIGDFSRINDLVLVTEVMLSQVCGNLNYCEVGYIFNKQYVGEVIVFLNDVLEQFNSLCADELVNQLESNGVEYHEGVTIDGQGNNLDIRNYGSVMQMKAIAQTLYVGAYGDEYYDAEYLRNYNGPYETSGSELVFKR